MKLNELLRGIEVLKHRVAMAVADAGTYVGYTATAGAITAGITARVLAGEDWFLFWRFQAARFLDLVGLGNVKSLAIARQTPAAFLQDYSYTYHDTFMLTLPVSVLAGLGAMGVVGVYAYKQARKTAAEFKTKHLRGARIVAQTELVAAVQKFNAQAAERWADKPEAERPLELPFCGVPVPMGMAQRNFLFTGGMGSGKSVGIFNLADRVGAAGRFMLVYDKTTEFTRQYYRGAEYDVILNPLDMRFPGWSILNDIESPADCEQAAAAFIPKQKEGQSGDAYFQDGPRLVISSIFQKLISQGFRRNEDICRVAFEFTPAQLHAWLVPGSPAANLIDPEGKGNGGAGILTSMQLALNVLRYVPDGDFSLRKTIRAAGDKRVFINSNEATIDTLRPFNALALTLGVRHIMSGPEVSYDRFWLFADEIASLGSMPVLKSAITEGRKYGLVQVYGAQNAAQFVELFGKDAAKTVRSNLGNFVILRVTDEETAKMYSDLLGDEEQDEQSQNISFSAQGERGDSEGVSTQRKQRKLVLPSEIQTLPDMCGFVKVAGDFAVAKVQFSYKDRLPKPAGWREADGFILREGFAFEQVERKGELVAPEAASGPGAKGERKAVSRRDAFKL